MGSDYAAVRHTIESLRGARARFRETLKNNPNIDKHGFGFNLDDRFSAFKVTLSLDSWTGVYGSSSCHTFLPICDANETAKALVLWLNEHLDMVLNGTADCLERRSKSARLVRLAELRAEIERLESAAPHEEADRG